MRKSILALAVVTAGAIVLVALRLGTSGAGTVDRSVATPHVPGAAAGPSQPPDRQTSAPTAARPASSSAPAGLSTAPLASSGASPPSTARPPRATAGRKLLDALAGRTIGIDPGHNRLNYTAPERINRPVWDGREMKPCNTTGTATDSGYPEATFTFRVASYLAAIVRRAGGRVVLTRHGNSDVGPCVDRRAEIIDAARAAVAIDIHADGGPADGRGFAILTPVPSRVNSAVVPASIRYAHVLRRAFLSTGMPISTYLGDHGFQPRPDLAGLNLTTVPQVLIECGNMRNRTDARLLTSAEFQRRAARAIALAMARFLGSGR